MDKTPDLSKKRLWTRQNIKSLEDIKNHGVFMAKREYIQEQYRDIAPFYMELYKWFVHACQSKIQVPQGVEFPIWCSVSREGMLNPVEGTVCYELEVDADKVIYFDGKKWDSVLNHWYVPTSEEDLESYKQRIQSLNLDVNTVSFIKGKYANMYPLEKKKVIESWYNIFKIDQWDPYTTQANIWEIRPDMIKNIIYPGDI